MYAFDPNRTNRKYGQAMQRTGFKAKGCALLPEAVLSDMARS